MRQAFMKEFMTRKQARPWPVMCSITCGPFYIFCRVTPGGIIQPTLCRAACCLLQSGRRVQRSAESSL
jgi:hypothetical protein